MIHNLLYTDLYTQRYDGLSFSLLIKHALIVFLSFVSFFITIWISEKILGEKISVASFLFPFILAAIFVNWLIFQIFYPSYYIVIPYLLLCVMNIASFSLCIFICKQFIEAGYIVLNFKITKENAIVPFIVLLFTLVHFIIVIRGNGIPKMSCVVIDDVLFPVKCGLNGVVDGSYIFAVGPYLSLVDAPSESGFSIELKVKNKQIDSCKLFSRKQPVDYFEITTNNGVKYFKGFDQNGNILGIEPSDISSNEPLIVFLLKVARVFVI